MAHHSRLLVSSLLLLCACASSRPAPTPGPVHAPPTATAAPDTAWPDTIDGRWVKIGKSSEGGASYIDRQTFVRDQGKGGSAWVRIYERDRSYNQVEDRFNCSARENRITQGTAYNSQGGVVRSSSQPGKWETPDPGSLAEVVLEVVCAR
jgi:hypothetical protein